MPRRLSLLPEFSPSGKTILAAIVILIFLGYAVVQLTCNALAPEKPERPAAESEK
jgi:hypothetical protein